MSRLGMEEQQVHQSRYRNLVVEQQTLLLSTVSSEGLPECSYAPYVKDQQGVFFIYVSNLAIHTRNMLQTGVASVLFIQAENEAKNLFARERVILSCSIDELQSIDQNYETLLLAMKQKFGETVDLLRTLSDFHLLALKPVSGKYIAGFGQAYEVDTVNDQLKFDENK